MHPLFEAKHHGAIWCGCWMLFDIDVMFYSLSQRETKAHTYPVYLRFHPKSPRQRSPLGGHETLQIGIQFASDDLNAGSLVVCVPAVPGFFWLCHMTYVRKHIVIPICMVPRSYHWRFRIGCIPGKVQPETNNLLKWLGKQYFLNLVVSWNLTKPLSVVWECLIHSMAACIQPVWTTTNTPTIFTTTTRMWIQRNLGAPHLCFLLALESQQGGRRQQDGWSSGVTVREKKLGHIANIGLCKTNKVHWSNVCWQITFFL